MRRAYVYQKNIDGHPHYLSSETADTWRRYGDVVKDGRLKVSMRFDDSAMHATVAKRFVHFVREPVSAVVEAYLEASGIHFLDFVQEVNLLAIRRGVEPATLRTLVNRARSQFYRVDPVSVPDLPSSPTASPDHPKP